MVGGLAFEEEKKRVGMAEIRRESCFYCTPSRTSAYLAILDFFFFLGKLSRYILGRTHGIPVPMLHSTKPSVFNFN